MLVVIFAGLRAPVRTVSKKIGVTGGAAREGEPLHVVGGEDAKGEGKIDAGMSRCGGNDGGKVRWEFLERGPLIESGIGAAPHGHLTVAPRLLGEPFDDVVAVLRLI